MLKEIKIIYIMWMFVDIIYNNLFADMEINKEKGSLIFILYFKLVIDNIAVYRKKSLILI